MDLGNRRPIGLGASRITLPRRAAARPRAARGTAATRAGRAGAALDESSSAKIACASASRAASGLLPLGDEPLAQLAVPRGRRGRCGARRAAARRCRSSGSPPAGTRRRSGPPAQRSSREPCPNAIALPASRPSRRTRKRRCLPSPTVASSPSPQPGASSVSAGLPSPNGASRASSAHRSSVSSAPRGDDRVDRVTGARSSSSSSRCGVRGERLANASTFSGLIDRPAAARCPPQRPSRSAHAPSARVEVEVGDRTAGSLPVALACPR